MSETSSVLSGSVVSSPRLLQLALKGEWIVVEQTIKALDKGDPEIFQTDEVNFGIFGSESLAMAKVVVGHPKSHHC